MWKLSPKCKWKMKNRIGNIDIKAKEGDVAQLQNYEEENLTEKLLADKNPEEIVDIIINFENLDFEKAIEIMIRDEKFLTIVRCMARRWRVVKQTNLIKMTQRLKKLMIIIRDNAPEVFTYIKSNNSELIEELGL